MTANLVISLYQESNSVAAIVKLTADGEPCDIAQHTIPDADKWHALRTILEDAEIVGAEGLRIFSTVPFDLSTLPEEPPNVDKYWIPEKGGKGKYIKGKWGGNADYWRCLHLIHGYRNYSIKLVQPSQIPGTVKLWQEFNR